MQNNVIYGAFGSTRIADAPSAPSSIARVQETTPATLSGRLAAQIKVLNELGALLEEPDLPTEISHPLKARLTILHTHADELSKRLVKAHTDDQAFLAVQPELTKFTSALLEFEADVMHKTGAQLELVNIPQPSAPMTQQLHGLGSKLVNSPKFWLSLSAGVAVLGGLLYWGLNHKQRSTSEPLIKKVERVKLRRAMPAR